MKGPLDIHQYLLAHDVHHEIVRLPRTAQGGHGLPETVAILPPERCIVVHPFHATAGPAEFLVVLLTTATEAPPDDVHDRLADLLDDELGRPVLIAPATCDQVSRHTDYVASHLGPLLLPADVVVVTSDEVVALATAVVYCATGDCGTALGIPADELLALSNARGLSRRPAPVAATVGAVGAVRAAIPAPAGPDLPVYAGSALGSRPLLMLDVDDVPDMVDFRS